MNAASTVTTGLNAAFRLARGRPDGVMLVTGDRQTIIRSFWAMFFSIPLAAGRLMMIWAETGVPKDAAYLAGREILVFVLEWLLFVDITYRLASVLGRAERWGRFIAVWNWCNVIEGMLVILGGAPGVFRAPTIVDQAGELIAIGWALWLEWYATRLTLGVGSLTAAWLVLLDQAIGVLLASLAVTLTS